MKTNHIIAHTQGRSSIETLSIIIFITVVILIGFLHRSTSQAEASEENKEEKVLVDSLDPGRLAKDIANIYEFAVDQKVIQVSKIHNIDDVLNVIRTYPHLLNVPPPLKVALRVRLVNEENLKKYLVLQQDGQLVLKKSK